MPRRREIQKRKITPDAKHGSALAAKFVNSLMKQGKKSTAESILYGAFDIIEKRMKDLPPLGVFEKALDNVKPVIEVRSRRVGGATYQVPTEVAPGRRQALAFRWIIGHSMSRAEKTMREKLAGELMDAAQNRGASVKKREDVHKMAEANKAFAHYRF
jgi:small subunit ribosomal protein S7